MFEREYNGSHLKTDSGKKQDEIFCGFSCSSLYFYLCQAIKNPLPCSCKNPLLFSLYTVLLSALLRLMSDVLIEHDIMNSVCITYNVEQY